MAHQAAQAAASHDEQSQCPPPQEVRCGWLLTLPQPLERAFWADERTIRAYTTLDAMAACNAFVGCLLLGRLLWRTMADPQLIAMAWDLLFSYTTGLLSSAVTLVWLTLFRSHYSQHRHSIALANRLIRILQLVVTSWHRNAAAQAAMNRAVRLAAGNAGGRSDVMVALINLARPMYMSSFIYMGQGIFVVRQTVWLPLQLLAFVLTCVTMRFQPCRLAGDPFAARMLLPTVDGMSRLHDTLLSVVLGVQLVLPDRHARSSTSLNAAASGELLRAARILSIYNIASYTLLITMGITFSLERRLKARFLAQQGKQLVYGPAGWLWRGRREPSGGAAGWPSFVVVIVLAPAAFRVLWLLCLWLVPLLPYAPCDTCADNGTCAALAPCEGLLCTEPGVSAAIVILGEMLVVLALGLMFLWHSLAAV